MRRLRRRKPGYSPTYVAPHKRYKDHRAGGMRHPNGGFFRRVWGAICRAGAFLAGILSLPFAALANMFRGRRRRVGRPLAVSMEGPAVPDMPLGYVAAPQHSAIPKALPLVMVPGILLSAAFMVWAMLFSDTSILVSVEMDGMARTIKTKAESVDELFTENGIYPRADDRINYTLSSSLVDGMKITVESAFPVAVASKGNVTILQMHEGSVGYALELAGIDYDSGDEITRLTYEDVEPGMHIQHIDVQTSYETVDQPIRYNQDEIKDSSRYTGDETILVKGEDGEKRIIRRIVYKDGVLSSREIMNQIILKEAVDEVKRVGTKIRYQTKLTGDDRLWRAKPTDSEIKSTMKAEVTAYTHTGRRTATGKWPKVGYVAVNPSLIPYGTKLYIPGYGYCSAQDTGSFRNAENGTKSLIDLFMNTEKECRAWGRKNNVTIYILK